MAVTFSNVMDFHPGNSDVYEEIKDALRGHQLLPFIGEDLIAPFYGRRYEAIRELGEYIADDTVRSKLDSILNDQDNKDRCYLAAQLLEDIRTGFNFEHDLIRYYSADKLAGQEELLNRQAISVLPHLFPKCPILTTNIDETLEHVYKNEGIILTPVNATDDELRMQARRLSNTSCIFKLHGSVTGSMTSYDNIIFTQSQIEKHYGSESPVREALRDFMDNRIMLFLGCGLEQDQTIDALLDVAKPGSWHYAIVCCRREERDSRVKALADAHIRAIVYEGEEHDSTRIVLEKLLEDLEPKVYDSLPFKLSALPRRIMRNPYKYDSGLIPLIGREKEMEQLTQFVTGTHESFLWWALTGPGGSGKSRVALELQNRIENLPKWHCIKLDSQKYGKLSDFPNKRDKNILVIADYVQSHARELGACMEKLAGQERGMRFRLLLVERGGWTLDYQQGMGIRGSGATWQRELFEDVHDNDVVRDACWNSKPLRNAEFLRLNPLDDEELLRMSEIFAHGLRDVKISNRPEPTAHEREALLEHLKKVDPKLCRPLYLLFLTGTLMDGDNPLEWDRREILTRVIERETRLLDERIREVTHSKDCNDELYDSCLQLYRLSTALLGKPIKTMRKYYNDEWKAFSDFAMLEAHLRAEKLLARIGLIRDDKLITMEPDIMGEFFVYDWLCNEASDSERRHFLSIVWNNERDSAVFFDRLFADCGYLLNENPEHWLKLLPPVDEASDVTAPSLRAKLLVNITLHCNNDIITTVAHYRNEALRARFPKDPDVALALAQRLFNLSNNQEAQEAKKTIDRIQNLQHEFPDNCEITLRLAQGLFNLSNKSNAIPFDWVVGRIEKLQKHFNSDPNIALALAKSLVGLSLDQDVDTAEKSVDRIAKLYKDFKDNPDIALALARGLADLSFDQDVIKSRTSINRIKALLHHFPNNGEIALELAKGLVNLSVKQNEGSAKWTVAQIEALSKMFEKNNDLVLALAKGLINLCDKQNLETVGHTVDRIESLWKKLPKDREMARLYTKSLLLLAYKQKKQGVGIARNNVNRLKLLEEQYPGIAEEAVSKMIV